MGGVNNLGILDGMQPQSDPAMAGILDLLKPGRMSEPAIAELLRMIQMQRRMQPQFAQQIRGPVSTTGVRG